MTFMEKVRHVLERKHLKPADLARMTGFSRPRFSKWFDGQGIPNVYQAAEIARKLDVPLAWLADDDAAELPEDGRSEQEREILKLANRLGYDEALNRLINAPEVPAPAERPRKTSVVHPPKGNLGREKGVG